MGKRGWAEKENVEQTDPNITELTKLYQTKVLQKLSKSTLLVSTHLNSTSCTSVTAIPTLCNKRFRKLPPI